MRALAAVLAVSLACLACLVCLVACASMLGGGSSGKTQCPGSQRSCLTAPQCSWDQANACEICHCSPAAAPEDFTPQGPPRTE